AFDELGDTSQAIRLRAILYLDMGRYQEAADDLQVALEDEPFDEIAHFKLAEAFRGLGNAARATRHFQIAAEIKQKRLRITDLLVQVERKPDDRAACAELGELYRDLNDTGRAQKWEQQAAAGEQITP